MNNNYFIMGIPTENLKNLFNNKNRNLLLEDLKKSFADVVDAVIDDEDYTNIKFDINSKGIAIVFLRNSNQIEKLKSYFEKVFITGIGDFCFDNRDAKSRDEFIDKRLIDKITVAEAINISGMSQVEVAEKMGITRQRLNQWTTGYRNPNSENLKKIAVICGINIDRLL
jgi:DNA-binding XRE family transcriptional regulator